MAQRVCTYCVKSHRITGAVTILEEAFQCWTGEFLKVRDFFPAWIGSEKNVVHVRKALEYLDPEIVLWEFSTDGVFTAHRGIPTVGFGPGDWSHAHQPNEAVPLKEVEQAAKGYTRIIDMLELVPG